MKLSAPTKVSFLIALCLVIVGLLAEIGVVGALSGIAFWLEFAGGAVLLLATLLKGL